MRRKKQEVEKRNEIENEAQVEEVAAQEAKAVRDEDKGKKLYYKSPLFEEPVAKIKWGDLIGETKKFMAKNWHTIASEYIERFCSDIEIVDPFTGDNIKLGKGAKRAVDIESDAFEPFKTYKDTKFKDFDTFMLNAEGDYNENEIETIKSYYKTS